MAGVRAFDGHFHNLDDIWELNLQTNTWRCLLPLGCFNPARLRVAAYFQRMNGLVVFEGMGPEDVGRFSARAWLFRPGIDSKPVRLPATGDVPQLSQAWSYTVDPANGDLLMFASEGIYRIAVNPS